MNINITKEQQTMLANSISTQMAALKRAANTEKDEDVREMRQRAYDKHHTLMMHIMSGEINETPISKQK